MRTTIAVLVVAALAFVGYRAGSRLVDDQTPDGDDRSTPEQVADAWAAATEARDVDRLVELASQRADTDALRDTHEQVLSVLGGVTVEVIEATPGGQDNRATAVLGFRSTPGASGGEWTWTSELELIRGRGVWSADWEPAALHPRLRPGWRLEVDEQPPSRAPILDHEGQALSARGTQVEIGVEPGRLPDRARLESTVASVLPEASEPLAELLERDDLVEDWYYPLLTVSTERADAAWTELVSLPGLIRRETDAGGSRAVAAPELIGSVEQAEDGVRRGASGLEQAFDDRLTGSATTEVRLVDPDGRERGSLFVFQDDPAPPLVVTIDRDLQQAVDDAVVTVDDPVGIVVLDVATMGVRAVASKPATGYARALEGRYPPAGVAGLVPVTAALEGGASLDEPLECPEQATVGGLRITARSDPPTDPILRQALGGGCDVALARFGVDLGDDALQGAVATLGLDEELDLPVPASGWSWPAADSDAALASWSAGEGRVETSTLGAAQLAATVARGAPGAPVVLVDAVAADPTPLDQGLTTALRELLRAAGTDGPVQVADGRVAGFATRSGGVSGDPAPATGWWLGFIEGGVADVAIAVVVEGGDDSRAIELAQRVASELAG